LTRPSRQIYELGAVVAVPVTDGLWGVAVVARWNASRRGHKEVLLYGIDRRFAALPTFDEASDIKLCQSVCMAFQGDRAIHEGRWPVLGHLPGFSRTEWPMPPYRSGAEIIWRDNPDLEMKIVRNIELPERLRVQLPWARGVGNATWLAGVFRTLWIDDLDDHCIEIDEGRLAAWKEASIIVDEAMTGVSRRRSRD